jgi:hypothetical protein
MNLPRFNPVIVLLSSTFIAFGFSEIYLRSLGYRPWTPPDATHYPVSNACGAKGKQVSVKLAPSFEYKVTLSESGDRITSERPLPLNKQIWIFGDSFTLGQSLNDSETYPWKLQQAIPTHEVRNFGRCGASTITSLRRLEELLRTSKDKPEIAVLAYGSFHDARNVFARHWMKAASVDGSRAWTTEVARVDDDGKAVIEKKEVQYTEWPLVRVSALVSLLELGYNIRENRRANSVSRALISRFSELCKEHGILLILGSVLPDELGKETLNYFADQGLDTIDLSVDYTVPEYTNLPYDGHPSGKANTIFAQRLAKAIQSTGTVKVDFSRLH